MGAPKRTASTALADQTNSSSTSLGVPSSHSKKRVKTSPSTYAPVDHQAQKARGTGGTIESLVKEANSSIRSWFKRANFLRPSSRSSTPQTGGGHALTPNFDPYGSTTHPSFRLSSKTKLAAPPLNNGFERLRIGNRATPKGKEKEGARPPSGEFTFRPGGPMSTPIAKAFPSTSKPSNSTPTTFVAEDGIDHELRARTLDHINALRSRKGQPPIPAFDPSPSSSQKPQSSQKAKGKEVVEEGYVRKVPMGSLKHQKEIKEKERRMLEDLRRSGGSGEGGSGGGAVHSRENMGLNEYRRMLARQREDAGEFPQDSVTHLANLIQSAKITRDAPRLVHQTYDALKAKRLAHDKELEERAKPKGPPRRKFPVKVTQEQMEEINDLWTGSPSEEISSTQGAAVTRKDILTLRGLTWLNDEPITFYSVMINNRSKKFDDVPGRTDENGVKYKKAFSFNSFFYKKFCTPESQQGGYKGVKRWSRRADLFAQDIVIIPINQHNSHWVCAAINFALKRFEYYDSLGGPNPGVYRKLREYIAAESLDKKKKEFDFEGWEDHWDDDVPQQQNSCDCGIFTCQFMESLSRHDGPFDFTQKQMPYFRHKMVLEMKHQELIVEPFA
ncbi:sentrin-specific protease 1 [Pseudohyphozyma bogoriensis]|nr:sentrin-specific protease 1 [Pseudohyphozyma bogoriensis]